MKKITGYLIITFTLILLITIAFLIYAEYGNSDSDGYEVFFLKEEGSTYSLEPEKLYTLTSQRNGIAAELIDRLLKGPDRSGLISPFPSGIKLLSHSISNNAVYLNFSQEYRKMSVFQMNLADYCLVKTLTGISGISEIYIRISGDPHPVSGYNPISLKNFIADLDSFSVKTVNQKLYLPSADNRYLIAKIITYQRYNNENAAEKVISMLLEGDEESGSSLEFPANTILYSVIEENGIVYLDFSEEFNDFGTDPERAKIMIYSLVDSLTELPGINGVRFLINGYSAGTYAGINLDETVTHDLSYVGASD